MVPRRDRHCVVCIAGSIELGELLIEGWKVQKTTCDALIVAEEQEIKSGNDSNRDLESHASEAKEFAKHLSRIFERQVSARGLHAK